MSAALPLNSLDWIRGRGWPDPRGLLTGLLSVVIAQIAIVGYYMILRSIRPATIQNPPPVVTPLSRELWAHLSAPESFLMVYGYLIGVWMFDLLPDSYYDITTTWKVSHVVVQFFVVDFWTYVVHRLEHYFMVIYRNSHKAHHKFNNPKLYNAYNGSVGDTFILILIPLFLTAQMTRFVTCWDFVVFGTLYSAQFTLIHCEYHHPWDGILGFFGIGTAADHNVHHSMVKYNFGHFFMFCDILVGTYKSVEGDTKVSTVKYLTSYGSFVFLFYWYNLTYLIPVFIVAHWIWLRTQRTPTQRRATLPVDPKEVSPNSGKEATDLRKWHLTTEKGRQVWHYNNKQKPEEQNVTDKYFLGLDVSAELPPLNTPRNAYEATVNALKFYSKLQMEDGHWGNDYGGPLFLLPGLIFTCYISKTILPDPYKIEIIRYLTSLQREDGGWGLHIESVSTMFGTVMNYCTMRILGLPRSDPRMVKARTWIEKNGGAASVPAWGKFWLCALGLYEWEGLNPVPPELWVLPYWLPVHPGRWWCHCRVVYLPMAWIYGTRSTLPLNDLTKQLREELYIDVYETIDWPAQKNNVMKNDSYKGHSWLFLVAFGILGVYEQTPIKSLRDYSLKVTLDHIRYEDTETHGICIGPVNKALDMLVEYWASGGKSELFKLHQSRIYDYLWLASDGMKMQGYNGSQLWDTAFSLQAIMETGLGDEEEFKQTIVKGYDYIDISQVRENNRDFKQYYRHISKGAWPFSTIDHGWPISDCTAEGFTCALLMPLNLKCCKPLAISEDRLFDSVNVMLSYQNTDGGWPSYENQRGPAFLELLNPADCFDKIMVDYSYVECSSACMMALLRFHKHFPNHRPKEILSAVSRGVQFLKNIQKKDGSWHGCWGVCYTYAGWFATNALTMAKEVGLGKGVDHTLKLAFEFLLSKQHEDGSWGEDFKSCSERRWVDLPEGHVVNTGWAILCLMNMKPLPMEEIEKGIKWLIQKQLPNGDWEQTTISGVFNYNCAISYSGYKNIFPIWALGKYLKLKQNTQTKEEFKKVRPTETKVEKQGGKTKTVENKKLTNKTEEPTQNKPKQKQTPTNKKPQNQKQPTNEKPMK